MKIKYDDFRMVLLEGLALTCLFAGCFKLFAPEYTASAFGIGVAITLILSFVAFIVD